MNERTRKSLQRRLQALLQELADAGRAMNNGKDIVIFIECGESFNVADAEAWDSFTERQSPFRSDAVLFSLDVRRPEGCTCLDAGAW